MQTNLIRLVPRRLDGAPKSISDLRGEFSIL